MKSKFQFRKKIKYFEFVQKIASQHSINFIKNSLQAVSGTKFGDLFHKINPTVAFMEMLKCRADAIRDAVAGTDHSKK